jgi:hypothetical protein
LTPNHTTSAREACTDMPDSSPATLSIPWRTVSFCSTFVAIAAVAALAIVAYEHGADGLSTIALALAILAFVVQLMVFIAQEGLATRQAQRGEEIYTRTSGILERIEERSSGTQRLVEEQRGFILKAAQGAVSEVIAEQDADVDDADVAQSIDPGALAAKFEQLLADYQRRRPVAAPSAADVPLSDPTLASEARRQRARESQAKARSMRAYPPEEDGRKRAVALKSLSPRAVGELGRRMDAELSAVAGGREVRGLRGPEAAMPRAVRELLDRGLLTDERDPADALPEGSVNLVLSEEGRRMIPLFRGRVPAPKWLEDELG